MGPGSGDVSEKLPDETGTPGVDRAYLAGTGLGNRHCIETLDGEEILNRFHRIMFISHILFGRIPGRTIRQAWLPGLCSYGHDDGDFLVRELFH